MNILDYVGIYLVVAVIIVVATLVMLRSEPTAHGQIVGTQVGCLVAVLWPIALPYFLVMAIVLGVQRLFEGKGNG